MFTNISGMDHDDAIRLASAYTPRKIMIDNIPDSSYKNMNVVYTGDVERIENVIETGFAKNYRQYAAIYAIYSLLAS